MDKIQAAKSVVRKFHAQLDARDANLDAVMTAFSGSDFLWRGFHPFGLIDNPEAVANQFWAPLKQSLTSLQRREDVFFAAENSLDADRAVWVVSMGHLVGLFDRSWLNIRPTGKMASLRYCAFYKVEQEAIVETAMYFDVPHLMVQAGMNPFPPQTGTHMVQPGPMTHDGLQVDPQPAEEGARTLAAINRMIADIGQWDSGMSLEDELRRSWHEDMLWWGPEGIGATFTIERYAKQHAGPFRAAFADRSATGHICRLAEGSYGGFFGWPNFTARPVGGFMGMPATGQVGEFRVIDIYRRDGDKLAENWIFIDLLHFWKQQGVDILARTTHQDLP
ncbi:ester cyclase [Phaeobacter sp.]|uniref:nuclear transport factor 2 family protein n=1 Tax=Phaeobacter sp. TaxID=1902409 RepID=UPI0025D7FE49|nr:ester cyclase [Phaeobacter sp.]